MRAMETPLTSYKWQANPDISLFFLFSLAHEYTGIVLSALSPLIFES